MTFVISTNYGSPLPPLNKKKKLLRIASYKVRIMIYERTCNSDFFFFIKKVYIWVYISQFWLFPQLRVKVQFWGGFWGDWYVLIIASFISYNSDFITLNCKFLSHNSEKIRIARYKSQLSINSQFWPFFNLAIEFITQFWLYFSELQVYISELWL